MKTLDKHLQSFHQKMTKLQVPKMPNPMKRNSAGPAQLPTFPQPEFPRSLTSYGATLPVPQMPAKRSLSVNDIDTKSGGGSIKVPKVFFQKSKISAFSQNMKGSLPRSFSSLLHSPAAAAAASDKEFEDVRLKVGQSIFYVLSDSGGPAGGGSCLPSPQLNFRNKSKLFKKTFYRNVFLIM